MGCRGGAEGVEELMEFPGARSGWTVHLVPMKVDTMRPRPRHRMPNRGPSKCWLPSCPGRTMPSACPVAPQTMASPEEFLTHPDSGALSGCTQLSPPSSQGSEPAILSAIIFIFHSFTH